MGFQKHLEQVNIENAINGEMKTKLVEILPILTKQRLSSLASTYNIPGRSKMNKQELADNLFDYLTDAERLEETLFIAESKEWEIFQQLFRDSFLQDHSIAYGRYAFLMERGLIYSFYIEDEIYFVMPDEIKQAYNSIDHKLFVKTRERYQTVRKYILAMTNLYGAFKTDMLVEVFNNQNHMKLDIGELITIYHRLAKRDERFYLNGDYIISDYFMYDGMEEFEELLDDIKGKPYYIPEKNKLLKYADDNYFELTPQLTALKIFILNELCTDRQLVDYLIDDIQLACSMEAPIEDVMYEFERRGIIFKDRNQISRFVPFIVDVYNHTRLWANCGHTPAEMRALSDEESEMMPLPADIIPFHTQVRNEKKIGRNDPCPCGSGKKYKKCCGA